MARKAGAAHQLASARDLLPMVKMSDDSRVEQAVLLPLTKIGELKSRPILLVFGR